MRQKRNGKSPRHIQMGYDQNTKRWELIIQYNGTVEKLQEQLPQAEIYPLSGGYAIVRLPESQVDDLAGLSQVEYIEKPKRLYFEVNRRFVMPVLRRCRVEIKSLKMCMAEMLI